MPDRLVAVWLQAKDDMDQASPESEDRQGRDLADNDQSESTLYQPGPVEGFLLRVRTIRELNAMLVRGAHWWLIPLVVLLVLLGLVLVSVQSLQGIGPFIYMVF